MTAGRNESVGGVIGAGKGTVRGHIAIHIVRYGVPIEHHKSIIGVILEATIGRIGNVTGSVVGKGLLGKNVAAQILGRSLGHTVEAIISIAESGVFVKDFVKNSRTRKCG